MGCLFKRFLGIASLGMSPISVSRFHNQVIGSVHGYRISKDRHILATNVTTKDQSTFVARF